MMYFASIRATVKEKYRLYNVIKMLTTQLFAEKITQTL